MTEALATLAAADEKTPYSPAAAMLAIIERAATNPNVDIEKMERLLAMRDQMEASEAKRSYYAALADMQPTLPTIDRTGRIIVLSKSDREAGRLDAKPQQDTPYASLEDIIEAVRPHLAEYGFALSFRAGAAPDGKLTVTGILSHRDGHSEETTMSLMHDSSGSKNAVQAIGSSISYGRRYTTLMLLNIVSRAPTDRDDDGVKAGAKEPISEEQLSELRALLKSTGDAEAQEKRAAEYFKVSKLAELPAGKFEQAKKALEAKARKAEAVR